MDISKNLDEIRKSLDTSIKLVAVSKTKSNQQIMEAYNHGQRIFGENRLTKCKQLVSHLSILSDIISPENGFALYFEIYLRQIIDGTIDKNLLMRLKTRLDTSNYWQDRFKAFNLSIDDLLIVLKSLNPLL